MDQIKNCPECEKKGASVAMKKRKRAKPEGSGAMFEADDQWVCPSCNYVETAED